MSILNSSNSNLNHLHSTGVAQGSVLGPPLFIIFFLLVSFRKFNMHFHGYMDDTQLCPINLLPPKSLTVHLQEIKPWLSSKFNKTEVLRIGMKSTLTKLNSFLVNIDNSIVFPSTQVNGLGVILNSTASCQAHISKVTRYSTFPSTEDESSLPTPNSTVALIHYLVTSCRLLKFPSFWSPFQAPL